jgi:hypothetical protein
MTTRNEGLWKVLKRPVEPVSPATRRTSRLFGLSGLMGALAGLALMLSAQDKEHPWELLSNSPISVRIAIIATALWLLSHGVAWWWYFSADEHERRANDVGFLIAGGLFMAATPVWWVGARAGLLPPPDAMILWLATMVVMGIGWAWHRSR